MSEATEPSNEPSNEFDLREIMRRQAEWSFRTFGSGRRTEGILRHIDSEQDEVRAHPLDVTEWIDIAILALDGAWRAGFSPEEVAKAFLAKQARNRTRIYHMTDDDTPSEHVREADARQ